MPHSSIDESLARIVRFYRPGTLNEMQADPEVWEQVLHLESEINEATLAGEVDRLRRALNNYELFILVNTVFKGSRLVTGPENDTTGTESNTEGESGMKLNEMFPSRFLTKDDVAVPKVFQIDSIEIEEVENEDGKESKPILYFQEKESKPLILNKTNAQTLEEEFGKDSEDWRGHSIELYVDPSIKFGSRKIGGIRLRRTGQSDLF